jgi:hypothetical protein
MASAMHILFHGVGPVGAAPRGKTASLANPPRSDLPQGATWPVSDQRGNF